VNKELLEDSWDLLMDMFEDSPPGTTESVVKTDEEETDFSITHDEMVAEMKLITQEEEEYEDSHETNVGS
jgi:hypothetical protein